MTRVIEQQDSEKASLCKFSNGHLREWAEQRLFEQIPIKPVE